MEQGFYEWDCDQQPLSSGPFILEEWVTDDHLTFIRNENYFDAGKPGVDKVVLRIVPEESVRETIMLESDADGKGQRKFLSKCSPEVAGQDQHTLVVGVAAHTRFPLDIHDPLAPHEGLRRDPRRPAKGEIAESRELP